MLLHRLDADLQRLGNLPIGQPVRQVTQDLILALGERHVIRFGVGRLASSAFITLTAESAGDGSPRATRLMVATNTLADSSLRMNAAAPRAAARARYVGLSWAVMMTTCVCGIVSWIFSKASKPSMFGSRTSMSTTSGLCFRVLAIASVPLPASATIVTSSPASNFATPRRMTAGPPPQST